MPARRFELSDGTSNKFWEISVDGTRVTVKYGRIGTAGQVKTKDHGSTAAATADAEQLIREKTKKGYVEAAPAPDRDDSEAIAATLKALDDIEEWLTDHGASAIVASLNGPVSEDVLTAQEQRLGYPLPPELRAVYRRHDGQRNWGELRNTFFPRGIGGFCDLTAAVNRTNWSRAIGPWFQPNTEYDPAWDALKPLERTPEQTVPRTWMHVDLERSTKDLRPEECSTAWLVFAWEEVMAGLVHLRTGRVFSWEKGTGLSFEADSFGAYLVRLADDLWNDRHTLARDDTDDAEPIEDRAWQWG